MNGLFPEGLHCEQQTIEMSSKVVLSQVFILFYFFAPPAMDLVDTRKSCVCLKEEPFLTHLPSTRAVVLG